MLKQDPHVGRHEFLNNAHLMVLPHYTFDYSVVEWVR